MPQVQPWSHMQGHSRSPRGNIVTHGMAEGPISPRDILTHIDDVVSVMERELTGECTNFKHLMNALPEKDQQLEDKITELQKNLAHAETFHKEHNRQSRMHSQKIGELEEHIAEMKNKDSQYRIHIEELENEIGGYQAENEKSKEESAFQHNRIIELERLLFASHETDKRHLQQITDLGLRCKNQKRQIETLEEDVSNLCDTRARSQKKSRNPIAQKLTAWNICSSRLRVACKSKVRFMSRS